MQIISIRCNYWKRKKEINHFTFNAMKKLNQFTDYLNNLLLKYEWCTSHRDRYSIQEPKKEEKKIRIWQTTHNGITTKHN
jgi:hypothetical protein